MKCNLVNNTALYHSLTNPDTMTQLIKTVVNRKSRNMNRE